jgi:putative NADH-flavin reductase
MRLLVFGATGPTGQHLLLQGLGRGHDMTAFVRDPARLPLRHGSLRIAVGDAADSVAVNEAVAGQDAVLSALGVGRSFKSGGLIARTMKIIVPAMEGQQVSRFIIVSAFGVGDTRRDAPLLPGLVQRLLLADILADKLAGEDVLRSSTLAWTIVYPVLLTNERRQGGYRAAERLALYGMPKISRADVAEFVLNQVDDTTYLKKGVVISN